MSGHQARDPRFADRVHEEFEGQPYMMAIGARLGPVAPGEVDIVLDRRDDLLQQHGYFHGGVTGSLADSAAGFACMSLFDVDSGPLTTEYKVNLLAPAKGDMLVARGRVIKSGRTLSVARADVYGVTGGAETHVATGLFTIIQLKGLKPASA